MALSEEQKRAARLEKYQMNLEYIEQYRTPDTFYHVTHESNVDSILEHGFDPKRIGTGGGCQGGAGFSCAWTAYDAFDWGEKLFSTRCKIAVLKVTIPGIRIASHQMADECREQAKEFGLREGYIVRGEHGRYPSTSKLKALYHQSTDTQLLDVGWILSGLYLRTQGYDGYWIGFEEVVIMNFDLLTPQVFSRVGRIA